MIVKLEGTIERGDCEILGLIPVAMCVKRRTLHSRGKDELSSAT